MNFARTALLSFVILTSSCIAVQAQVVHSQKLDTYFSLLDDKDRGSGTISIHHNGSDVYTHSIGLSDMTAGQEIKSDRYTKYRIGSLSKTFTAAIILSMVADGTLSLDTPLAVFFPDIPGSKEITIKLLLNHHSGLHNFTEDEEYDTRQYGAWSREEHHAHFVKKGLDHQPDSLAKYSNTNFVLLSMIAELIDEDSYSSILRNRITRPLELNSTYYGNALSSTTNEARSFRYWGGWLGLENTHYSIPLGAGGVVSTADDINRFYTALFDLKLFKQDILDQMLDSRDNLGLGIIEKQYKEHLTYGHNGAIDGYRSVVTHFPGSNMTICYLANAERSDIDDIITDVLKMLFEEEFTLPEFNYFEPSEEDLRALLGTYELRKKDDYIKVSLENNLLFVQKKGQAHIPTEARSKYVFFNEQIGFNIVFSKSRKKMTLIQNGFQSKWKRSKK